MLTRRGAGLPGVSPARLRRSLWGNFAYSAKTQKVSKILSTSAKAKPLFVRLVLRMVWKVYKAAEADFAALASSTSGGASWQRITKIARDLGLTGSFEGEASAKSAVRFVFVFVCYHHYDLIEFDHFILAVCVRTTSCVSYE